jgi:hypothetical protein
MRTGAWWVPEANTDRFLVSSAARVAPSLAPVAVDGRKIVFLWLRPITREEEAFVKRESAAALEAKLDAVRANHLDLGRASVV